MSMYEEEGVHIVRSVSEPATPMSLEELQQLEGSTLRQEAGSGSEDSGATQGADITGTSQSGTDSLTPKSQDCLERSSSWNLCKDAAAWCPEPIILLSKDAHSLTFQWVKEEAMEEPMSEDESTTPRREAAEYLVELQELSETTGRLAPESEAAGDLFASGELVYHEDWQDVYRGTDSWIQVGNLSPGTCYAIRVSQVSGSGSEDGLSQLPKIAVFHTIPSCPGVPYGPLLAKRWSRQIKLKWSHPHDTGGCADLHFVLEMRPPPEGVTGPICSEGYWRTYEGRRTTCRISQLAPGTQYCFRLKAVNGVGDSDWSFTCKYATKLPVPCAPSGLHAVRDSSWGSDHGQSVRFEWLPPHYYPPAHQGYTVEIEDVSNGQKYTAYQGCLPFCFVTGLNADWVYSARVRAENRFGPGEWCKPYEFCTMPAYPCAPQHPTVADIKSTAAVVTWEPPQHGLGGLVNHYEVELLPLSRAAIRKSNKYWRLVYEASDTAFELCGLSGGCAYRVKIHAVSGAGSGPPALVEFATKDSVPDTPGLVHAVLRSSETLDVRWSMPEHDGGCNIEEYCLQMRREDGVDHQEDLPEYETVYRGMETNAKLDNLVPGAVYALRVQALNYVGGSEWSEVNFESTRYLPPASPCLPQVDMASSKNLVIKWKCNAPVLSGDSYEVEFIDALSLHKYDEGEPGAIYPQRSVSSSATFLSLATDSTSQLFETAPFKMLYNGRAESCTADDLSPDTEYLFRVRTVRGKKMHSNWSPLLEAKTMPLVPQQPPTLEVKNVGDASASFNCLVTETPMEDSTIALEIGEQLGRKVKWSAAYRGSAGICRAEGLEQGISYLARAKVVTGAGDGPFCIPIKFETVLPFPGVPSSLMVTAKSATCLRAQWANPLQEGCAPIDSYRLEVTKMDDNFSPEYIGSALSHQLSGLQPGCEYQLRLCACNSAGNGPWTPIAKVVMPLRGPKAPGNLRIVPNSAETWGMLTWDPPCSEQGWTQVAGYEVDVEKGKLQVKGRGGRVRVARMVVEEPYCSLADVATEEPCFVRVKAFGTHQDDGHRLSSKWSETISIQPLARKEAKTKDQVQEDLSGIAGEEIKAVVGGDGVAGKVQDTQPYEVMDAQQPLIPAGGSKNGRLEQRRVPRNIVRKPPQVRPRPQKKAHRVCKAFKSPVVVTAITMTVVMAVLCFFH